MLCWNWMDALRLSLCCEEKMDEEMLVNGHKVTVILRGKVSTNATNIAHAKLKDYGPSNCTHTVEHIYTHVYKARVVFKALQHIIPYSYVFFIFYAMWRELIIYYDGYFLVCYMYKIINCTSYSD